MQTSEKARKQATTKPRGPTESYPACTSWSRSRSSGEVRRRGVVFGSGTQADHHRQNNPQPSSSPMRTPITWSLLRQERCDVVPGSPEAVGVRWEPLGSP
jgi:hypothetical protein